MLKRGPWGKFEDGESHHLAHHCADVAACFEAITILPVLRARLEKAAGKSLSTTQIARLAVLTFLHDCGKLHPGFQAKGWPKGIWTERFHGHVAEGAAIFTDRALQQIAQNLHLESLEKWGVGKDLLFAVLAHHGHPVETSPQASRQWRALPDYGYNPLSASAEMGAMVRRWFPDAFADDVEKLPEKPDFEHLLSGLVSLADWLGSTRHIFRFARELDPDYAARAREKACQGVADIGLNVCRWRKSVSGRTDFATLTGGRKPRPQQRLVRKFPLDDPLLILEAETGSGKTEAALWRFVLLFEAQKVDSLYFALPTRAAAIQIHKRVNRAIERVFGPGAPEAVLAVPGYLKAGEVEGRKLPAWAVKWDDDGGANERMILARWAAESTKRALAAPIAIGTVDQAMLAALQVKHAHLRAGALSRSLLVIDEVHASDRYMIEVQTHLLRMHLGRGGHAMLMSATLGSVARTKWLKDPTLPTFEAAVAAPYPAVWGRAATVQQHSDHRAPNKTVSMTLIRTMAADNAAALAVDAARSGARVLVVRNTVDAAVAVFRAVQDEGAGDFLLQVKGGPALHHGRFAPEDRRLLDAEVEKTLSPERADAAGRIVIGTQTLEQSLDIDADFLLTDLCPMDVLLQRIGRLHRHPRRRPAGFEQARCSVFVPEEGLGALIEPPRFINGLGAWKTRHGLEGIYRDVSGLELTRRLIVERGIWKIPAMNRFLVESATHPERVESLHREVGRAWAEYWTAVSGKDVADAGAARMVAVPTDMHFADLQFPGNEETIRTRLGAKGALINFAAPVEGPFGNDISSVTLPGRWSDGFDSTEPVEPEAADGVVIINTGKRTFEYSRLGLHEAS